MLNQFGFFRVAAATPECRVGDVSFNVNEIIKQLQTAEKKGVQVGCFPELCITGYTCADLFFQDVLLNSALNGLQQILKETAPLSITAVLGFALRVDNQLFNTAVVFHKGQILGVVPKTYIPNYNEFYEKRWFSSSWSKLSNQITLLNQTVPFGTDLLFCDKNSSAIFGVEICEDLWTVSPPSDKLAANGANIICNLSASNELIGKYQYRKQLITQQSAKLIAGYVYSSCGINESSTDVVFSGFNMVAENGAILGEGERFLFESTLTVADLDLKKLINNRMKNSSYMNVMEEKISFRKLWFESKPIQEPLLRTYEKFPFVPSNTAERKARVEEIFKIQASGLAKRLKHIGGECKTVLGVSGGLDSTLAFLVVMEAYKKLHVDPSHLIAVTMPGFGTTQRTKNNAIALIQAYGATLKEIDIKAATTQHFKDIGQDEHSYDITYENAQARERTQILMDLANKEKAIVVGTGDLSELALGWCTYNGDHMSMYHVNVSIPKTLVKYIIDYVADSADIKEKEKLIRDIVGTPISPELLPPEKNDSIGQVTEKTVGPYALHDFFLFHFLRYGAEPKKILYLATQTFQNDYTPEEIKHWLREFLIRFFRFQFKRSALPDGPKVGTVSLSPRGDWRMPSDAVVTEWLKDIE